MGRVMKLWRRIVGYITAIVIVIAGLSVIPSWFGYQSYVVLSGSMKPVLSVGSVVYINTRDRLPDVGDIVTYQLSNGVTVTHRVIDMKDNKYITQGDANKTSDFEYVRANQIIGVYAFHIPFLGYVMSLFQSISIVFILLILIIANLTPEIWGLYLNLKKRKWSF